MNCSGYVAAMSRYSSKLNVSLGEGARVATEAAADSDEISDSAVLSPEQLANDVQRTQEKLVALKREQDVLERRKRELEDLARRQAEVEVGSGELTERLSRALVVMETQTTSARRRVEQLEHAAGTFRTHLQAIGQVDVKSCAPDTAAREITRALGLLDAARGDYDALRAKLLCEENDPESTTASAALSSPSGFAGGLSFADWLKAGVAFTLPVVLVALAILAVLCWRALAGH